MKVRGDERERRPFEATSAGTHDRNCAEGGPFRSLDGVHGAVPARKSSPETLGGLARRAARLPFAAMITNRAALSLVLAALAGCGGQIDGSVFDPGGDAAAPIDGATPDSGAPASDTGVTPPGPPQPADAGQPTPPPPTSGGDGSACTSPSECTGGFCQQGRCTSGCGSSADCVSGWRCSTQTNTCRCTPSGADCGGRDNNCDGVISSNAPCAGPTPGDAGPPPPPADAGPAPGTDSGLSCATCAQSSCAAETQACGNDATCRAFLQCVQPCASIPSACVTQCASKNNDATTQSFLGCMAKSCGGCT